MRAVSQEEFYKVVGPLNVHPTIVNSVYPYVSEWRETYSRRVVGKSVGVLGKGVHRYEYFLAV